MKTVSAAVAIAAMAGAANAVDLYLQQVENLDGLSTPVLPDGNPFWIGQNPTCIAFDGSSLYVGGTLNGPDPIKQSRDPITGEPLFDPVSGDPITEYLGWATSVVKIENFLAGPGNRTFRAMPDTRNQVTIFLGYTGLDYVPGVGLLTGYDNGSAGQAGQNQNFDVETQLNPILIAGTPSGDAPRGVSGPSWDLGLDGLGIDYQRNDPGAAGFGTLDGPVAAIADFGIDPNGPLGLEPSTMDSAIGATIYEPTAVAGGPEIGASLGKCGTIWRDIDIDPNTGVIAGRANNELILATRTADALTDAGVTAMASIAGPVIAGPYECAQTGADANTDGIAYDPFCGGQNVAILHGFPGGNKTVFVNRSDFSSPVQDGGCFETGHRFDDNIRMVDMAGAEQVINWLDANGSPLAIAQSEAEDDLADIPTTNGYFDFAWDEASQLLLIVSFETRNVYIFSPNPPPADCVADVNTTNTNPGDPGYGEPDGTVDGADLSFYVENWLGQVVAIADVNTTNTNPGDPGYGAPDGQVDGADLSFFVENWLAGCP